ncbi:MAG: hypothetical protein AAFR21_13750 [Pseudomonadota bacterium]
MSVTALFGLATIVLMVMAVSALLRQLGASDAAKGLIALTSIVFFGVVAATYVPALIFGF